MAKKGNSEILKKINTRAQAIREAAGKVSHTCSDYKMKWTDALKEAAKQIKRELSRTDAPIGRGEMSTKPKTTKPQAKKTTTQKKK